MDATPLKIDFEAALAAYQARRARHRSPGWHCSEILHYILARYDKERFGGESFELGLLQVGFLWEEVLSALFGQQFGRQTEVERDGIYCTLDGIALRCTREFKTTKLSQARPITSNRFWHWHMQTKAGCYAAGKQACEIYPLYINGRYDMGGGRFGVTACSPVLVTYTRRELRENWEMLLRTRDRMERKGLKPEKVA